MKTSMAAVLMTAMFLGSGCSHAKNNSEDTSSMIDMKNAKDWCAGRYTIKLPQNTKFFNGADTFNSFEITSKIGATVSDLNQAYERNRKYFSRPISTIIIDNPAKKIGNKTVRIFSAKAGTIKGAPLDLMAYVLDRNVLFTIKIPYMPEKKDLVFSELDHIITGLTARDNNTVPKESGVCITNGFIKVY